MLARVRGPLCRHLHVLALVNWSRCAMPQLPGRLQAQILTRAAATKSTGTSSSVAGIGLARTSCATLCRRCHVVLRNRRSRLVALPALPSPLPPAQNWQPSQGAASGGSNSPFSACQVRSRMRFVSAHSSALAGVSRANRKRTLALFLSVCPRARAHKQTHTHTQHQNTHAHIHERAHTRTHPNTYTHTCTHIHTHRSRVHKSWLHRRKSRGAQL